MEEGMETSGEKFLFLNKCIFKELLLQWLPKRGEITIRLKTQNYTFMLFLLSLSFHSDLVILLS